MHRTHIVCLLGLPGAGKNEKGKLLLDLLQSAHVDMQLQGMSQLIDWYRENAPEPVLRKKLQDFEPERKKGILLDSATANTIVSDYIHKQAMAGTYMILLDGYPRTESQAQSLCEVPGIETISVINFNISEEVSRARAALRNRADDTPEALRTRHEAAVHMNQAITYLMWRGSPVLPVDGTASIQTQLEECLDFLPLCDMVPVHSRMRLNNPNDRVVHAIRKIEGGDGSEKTIKSVDHTKSQYSDFAMSAQAVMSGLVPVGP